MQVNGPVIMAQGEANFAMHDMVWVGKAKLMGEVIRLDNDLATIQVYENSSGLTIGEKVEGTGAPLCLTLGPGLMGSVLDGVGRPLYRLQQKEGDFIQRGGRVSTLDEKKTWHFVPVVSKGDYVQQGSIIGKVQETESITHWILLDRETPGKIEKILPEGDYTVVDTIAEILGEEEKYSVTMKQLCPVRQARPYQKRLMAQEPLLTGQRVIDSIFPIAKGGTATIPGGFGTGKTMLQHQLAKWSDADIIIYIGCGERGNEMTQVLEEFPNLIDPRTGRALMERTILIANTSNMPVAARETSIYTGITIAEYYRDMGYQVALMADSTSRWAEALREISGRLEEMPAEEGFPSYLPSRLSEFYGRAGCVETLNGKIGSVTIIGAVSPQGSDFSEPVTQNTKRFVHVFWGLDRELAYARHYPAINWMISYSEYVERLEDWYIQQVGSDFLEVRNRLIQLLEEENDLLEISKVVGQDVLQDSKKLVLETCRAIRIGFLQQNALKENDTFVMMEKQYQLMKTILLLYDKSLQLISAGIPMSAIKKLGVFENYMQLKQTIHNNQPNKFVQKNKEYKEKLDKLQLAYQEHDLKKEV